MYQLIQADANGNVLDTQQFDAESDANSAYAVVNAGTPSVTGAAVLELWMVELDNSTGSISNRNLVAWRPLIPDAVPVAVQLQQLVDQSLAQSTIDLQQGLAPITTPLQSTIDANNADIAAVTSAIQKKASTAMATNTKAINSAVAGQQASKFSLSNISHACAGQYQLLAYGPDWGGILNATGDLVFTTIEDAYGFLQKESQYIAGFNTNNLAPLTSLVEGQGDYQIYNDGNGNYINLVCGQSVVGVDTVQPVPPTQLPVIPPDTVPVIPPDTVPVIPPTQIPQQCPQCGCKLDLSPIIGAIQNQQSISPVVDWQDPFAGVAGLLTPAQVQRVEDYLDLVDPEWHYKTISESIDASFIGVLPPTPTVQLPETGFTVDETNG